MALALTNSLPPFPNRSYRSVLAAQPDRSVTISSIGFATNLQALLASGPDQVSMLSGVELVRRKVRRVVWMGGRYPSSNGKYEWNFGGGGVGYGHSNVSSVATNYTLAQLPAEVQVVFSGAEVGSQIKTGGSFSKCAPAANPCRAAFAQYGVGRDGHASFDPANTLLGVRGAPGSGLPNPPYTINGTGGRNVAERLTGANTWVPGPGSNQTYTELAQPAASSAKAIGAAIDALLCAPRRRRG